MTAVPGAADPGPPPGAPGRHEHMWSLPDGTGLHAPPGRLLTEEASGRLCCHLCGQWFSALGIHVRVHGQTADTYRDAMGLPRTSVLAASRPARRGGQADYPRTVPATGTARAGRQHRSEGWTIIVTAAEGRQGSDWARWLLRQARAG